MDPIEEHDQANASAPKKTLRAAYANASAGLLLMMNEAVAEELRELRELRALVPPPTERPNGEAGANDGRRVSGFTSE